MAVLVCKNRFQLSFTFSWFMGTHHITVSFTVFLLLSCFSNGTIVCLLSSSPSALSLLLCPSLASTHSSLLDLDLLASFDNLASQTMSTPHAAVVCRRLPTSKDPNSAPLATTTTSGNPVLTSTPLQVEQLLANSKRSTPLPTQEKKNRDPTLSPEAVRVLDTLPELAFLSARMLMFPVQGDRNGNKL
ncbi:Aftiphilin [Frankliniella fusca]|uniref:Aftiphilin n=1 Tax=Frankliniella fusca TaxID=407009 RepID=A0AAE1LTB0_9NEOP|nr:Aftiphilin [Frankliniella fusca]